MSSSGALQVLVVGEAMESVVGVVMAAAPQAVVRVVKNFPEACHAAQEHRPRLLILHAPSPVTALEFLQDFHSLMMEAQALLLVDPEVWSDVGLAAEVEALEAFDNLNYPPDIEELRSKINRLVVHAITGGAHFTAFLRQVRLLDILQLKCQNRDSGMFCCTGPLGSRGYIFIERGQLRYVEADGEQGLAALSQLLAWGRGEIVQLDDYEKPRPNLNGEWQAILMEAVCLTDETLGKPAGAPAERSAIESVEGTDPATITEDRPVLLAADDSPLVLHCVEAVVHHHFRELALITIETGHEVLDTVRRYRPDLILLDYFLPDVTGDEICDALLEDPETTQIPIVLISGRLDNFEPLMARHPNIVACLRKPFYQPQLAAVLQAHAPRLRRWAARV
jgi:CheY-like chemotaxis protein